MKRDDHELRALRIPPQSNPTSEAFDARPRRITAWVRDLPTANVGETARRLYGALADLNGQTLDPAQRLSALERLREPVRDLEQMLERYYLHYRLPLPKGRRKAADLARALPAKLATGYKAAVRDLADAGTRPGHRHMALAVHRALSDLGHVLLRAYQAYVPVPPGVWLEIHTLYAFAERHDLLDRRVRDTLAPDGRRASIEEVYKRILLLALASPYRLHQGEAAALDAALTGWAHHARLDDRASPAGDARFVVTLDADAPPGDPDDRVGAPVTERRVLNTEGVLRVLRRELDRDPHHWWSLRRAEPALDPDLMRRLVRSWGRSPRRRFARTTRSTRIRAAIGLSAIHHLLASDTARDTERVSPVGYRSRFVGTPVRGDYGWVPDVWELTTHAPPTGEEPGEPGPAAGAEARETPYVPDRVRLLNVSSGGHCLLWDKDQPEKARVGELVWVPGPELGGAGHSGIGAVRWMKSVHGRGLELGVQLIAPTAHAAVARRAPEGQSPGPRTAALLMPAPAGADQARTVVLPAVPYRLGDRIAVIWNGRERYYRLRRLVEDAGGFRRFEVESLQPVGDQPSRTTTQRRADHRGGGSPERRQSDRISRA